MNKPRLPAMFRQPLWWWLGKSRWSTDEIELFGLTRQDVESDPWYERPERIWRRFNNVRPRPVAATKTRWKRGRDGWAVPDTWGLADYLSGWLPDALEHMREHAHGYPMGLCEHSAQGGPAFVACLTGECPEGCDGPALWDEVLRKIAEGFRAALAIDQMDWWESNAPREENDARLAALQATHDEGMALFVRWFFHLWD